MLPTICERMFNYPKTEVQTCSVHDPIGADGPMRGLDVPPAVGSRGEPGDGGRVVDLGAVHSGAGSESHSERVRVDVAVPGCVQTCQHLTIERSLHQCHHGRCNGAFF